MLRRLLCLAAALVATAETAPPALLAPYVKDGRFDAGDYGWMRGAYPGATPAEQATWQALLTWRKGCIEQRKATVRQQLASRGITTMSSDIGFGSDLCGSVGYALPSDRKGDWAGFQAALARARPIVQTIVWSARLAQSAADPDEPADAALLVARPITDQVLRGALEWGTGEVGGAPPLDPATKQVAATLLWQAIGERDHANTAWLKTLVARGGWPTIGKVGKTAANDAWLLVQHADDDPVFQLDMLRLMEPLADRGEVAKKDYAYLYDRVMLKLSGKQRYGSQMVCTGGQYTPQPLEDEAHVDSQRQAMTMGTLADYEAAMVKALGPCPPEPLPAAVIPPSPARR